MLALSVRGTVKPHLTVRPLLLCLIAAIVKRAIRVTHNTSVVCVRGLNPTVWQQDVEHVYVGRQAYLRSGPFAGESWGMSCFANPFKVERHMTRDERLIILFSYCQHLRRLLNTSPIAAQHFFLLQGKILGCWCFRWSGHGEPPLCHAAWLARIVDLYAASGSKGVLVTQSGTISPWNGVLDFTATSVVFKKTSGVDRPTAPVTEQAGQQR